MPAIGYSTPRDGEDALALLPADQDVSFDLLISDVVMPGMDGHTLVRLLGERPNAFAVIFMSGYAEDVIGGRTRPPATFS